MESNVKSFLNMLAISELTRALLQVSDNGYNVLVGSTATHPILFNGYAQHPHVYNAQFNSTAAGRYQIIYHTWISLTKQIGIFDFSPESQDACAVELIRQRDALELVIEGKIEEAIKACGGVWASLAGAAGGQHQNSMGFLKDAYWESGGKFA